MQFNIVFMCKKTIAVIECALHQQKDIHVLCVNIWNVNGKIKAYTVDVLPQCGTNSPDLVDIANVCNEGRLENVKPYALNSNICIDVILRWLFPTRTNILYM